MVGLWKNGRAEIERPWRCLCLGKGSKGDFQNAVARASPGMNKSASPMFCQWAMGQVHLFERKTITTTTNLAKARTKPAQQHQQPSLGTANAV